MHTDKLKALTGSTTTEDLFGVSVQPPDTCPLIYSFQTGADRELSDIRSYCKDIDRSTDDPVVASYASDILSAADSIDINDLELVRKRCELIREWGQEWKDIAVRMFELSIEKHPHVADKHLLIAEQYDQKQNQE